MSSALGNPPPVLRGRLNECDALDRLLTSVREGQSRALVIRGEAGIGKSALLEYLVQRASGCRVARAAGTEYEMELAYAGLHQLCFSSRSVGRRGEDAPHGRRTGTGADGIRSSTSSAPLNVKYLDLELLGPDANS